MKKLSFLLLSIAILMGCSQKNLQETVVMGHVSDQDIKNVKLKSGQLVYKTTVDSNGTFVLKFITEQPRVYDLKLGNNLKLFLVPGDSLVIKENSGKYSFSGGQSATLSQYYKDWRFYWDELTDTIDIDKYYGQEPEEYYRSVKHYLELCNVPLNDLILKKPNINPVFVNLEKESLKYFMYWDLLNYEMNYKRIHGKNPVVSESFYKYLDEIDLNDTLLLQLDNYKDFILSYGYKVIYQEFLKDTSLKLNDYEETNLILDSLPGKYSSNKIIDYVLYKIISERTTLLKVGEENLVRYSQICKNKENATKIKEKYNDLKFLLPGNPAPEFTLLDKDNKEYHLSDFKGKYLLIDVWGAYCGPCKREMPYLKRIEKEYHDKNIEFIGVCFEKDQDVWLKRIDEFGLECPQFTVENSWGSKFRNDYRIPWVPTFMLIDPEGKIIHARAPKPSEGLRELLDKSVV